MFETADHDFGDLLDALQRDGIFLLLLLPTVLRIPAVPANYREIPAERTAVWVGLLEEGTVLGHEFLEGPLEFTGLGRVQSRVELAEEGFDLGEVGGLGDEAEDLGMARFRQLLFVMREFFEEFLAWAEAGELDLDVFASPVAGKFDHLGGEVDDLDGFTHVQDEDLAALTQRARLQDQTHCLGNRHEVPGDVGVRYRDGTARGDLLLERRHHGSGRTEDVAEADRHETGMAGVRCLERLQEYLGHALARSHYAGGIDGLVRRDEHEPPDAAFVRQTREVGGAHGIVPDGLARLAFHHRNMLVGRGMEEGIRPMPLEDGPDTHGIADVGHQGYDDSSAAALDQLLLDLEDLDLGTFDQEEGPRRLGQDLAAELAPDGATCSGDGHDLIADQAPDSGLIECHGRAAQEILDLYGSELGHLHAACDQLVQGGHGVRGNSDLGRQARDLTEAGGRGGGHGDDHLPDLEPPLGLPHELRLSDDGDAVESLIPLHRIIVKEDDGLETEGRLVEDFADDRGPGIPGTHDGRGTGDALHGVLRHAVRPLALAPVAECSTGDGYSSGKEDQVQNHHASGDPDPEQRHCREEQESGQRVGKEQGPQVHHAEVGRQHIGLAGGDEHAGLGKDRPADDLQALNEVLPREVPIKADEVSRD